MKAPWAALGLLLVLVAPAAAQMVPDKDLRDLHANAYLSGASPDLQSFTPAFFALLDMDLNAFTEDGLGNGTGAHAQQYSAFTPGSIDYNGLTDAYWAGDLGGHYDAVSLADLRVVIPAPVSYHFFGTVDPMDGSGYVVVRSGLQKYLYVDHDTLEQYGRLPSGTYDFEARSEAISTVQSMNGAIYEMGWTCSVVASNISQQPGDKSVGWDSSATFCVTAATPSGTTYQWRKNLQPIPGATSTCFTVPHTEYPDTGYYDVVVTTGGVAEPSRLAHLDIIITGVDAGPSALRSFALGAATPNPSAALVSCRFDAAQPFRASVEVLDVSGRRVRHLDDRVLSGSGLVIWDGRTDEGSLAAPGIYFLRVMASGESRTRRVALVH